MPFISVIVPIFNTESVLKRSIQSVLAQSFSDFELLLIDDGSTDHSGKICDSIAEEDPRVRVMHTKNQGVSSARNLGISEAKGEYLFFLDSDDELKENAFQIYADSAMREKTDVIIGSLNVIEKTRISRKIGFENDLCVGKEIWTMICQNPDPFGYAGGKMVRSSLIEENRIGFNVQMKCQEDLDFFLSVYEKSQTFVLLNYAGYRYYYTPSTRIPPVPDLISNQIKMIKIAVEKISLPVQTYQEVIKKIKSLLYTALYHESGRKNYAELITQLNALTDLPLFLKEASGTWEQNFICRLFSNRRYITIKRYFKLRSIFRNIMYSITAGRKSNEPRTN